MEIDLKKLLNSGLSLSEYFLLRLIAEGTKDELDEVLAHPGVLEANAINNLVTQGYIDKDINLVKAKMEVNRIFGIRNTKTAKEYVAEVRRGS